MNTDINKLIDSVNNLVSELKKKEKQEIVPKVEHNMRYYVKRYIQEILEASLALLMVMFILKKPFLTFDFFKIVLVIALVTLILEEYNVEYLNTFKQGTLFTLGSLAFNN